jgi:ribose/xylose/arabinose/galactoside ABC-type transport system permease subunit
VSRHRGQTYGAVVALVLIVLLNVLFTGSFATSRTLWIVLLQASTTIIVAIGMTLVIATGGIDLSVGATMAVSSTVAVLAMSGGALVAVLAALGVGLLIGVLNGWFVAVMRVPPFIATLALLITGRGVAQVISREGQLIPFDDPAFLVLGRGTLGPVPVQVVLMAVCFAIAWFVMRATAFGRYAVAIGGNERAAELAGVPVVRTKWIVYAVSGLLAGLAGIIETARLGTTDAANVGRLMELAAIAAVVAGGTSLSGGRATLPGTIVGALIMTVITTSFNMLRLPYAWSLVATGAIILIAVWIQRPRLA